MRDVPQEELRWSHENIEPKRHERNTSEVALDMEEARLDFTMQVDRFGCDTDERGAGRAGLSAGVAPHFQFAGPAFRAGKTEALGGSWGKVLEG